MTVMAQKTNNMAFKMKKGSPMERNFGISPMQKGSTSFIDRIKAAGKAAVAGLGASSSSRSTNVASTISRAYKKAKREYRAEDEREKATENK